MRTVCAWYQVPQSYWRGWFFARFLRAYVQNATEGRLPEWEVRVDGQTGIKQILLDSYTQIAMITTLLINFLRSTHK